MSKNFCKSYPMVFSIVIISCNQRSCTLLRCNFRDCSFNYFSVIRSRDMKVCYHFIVICYPCNISDYSLCKSCTIIGILKCNKWHMINLLNLFAKKWYHFICICVPAKFVGCNLCKNCDVIFLICHVISPVTQLLHTISSFPPNLVYMSFFKLWHNNIENW